MRNTIFYVDDEQGVRDAVARTIRRLMPEVKLTVFESPKALLRAVFDAEFPPDLVITDRDMSELLGEEVARILKRAHYAGKVVMLTGNSSMEDAPPGVDQLLHKPIGAGELRAALRHCIGLEAPAATANP